MFNLDIEQLAEKFKNKNKIIYTVWNKKKMKIFNNFLKKYNKIIYLKINILNILY